MKISKLLIEKALGCSIEELEERQRGISTGYALKIIGEAMIQPGVGVVIHEPGNTNIGDRYLTEYIQQLLTKLELKFFTINNGPYLGLVYNPTIEVF
jgi:hypothetical protein